MFFSFSSRRDSRFIDGDFIKTVASYFDAVIYVYSVEPWGQGNSIDEIEKFATKLIRCYKPRTNSHESKICHVLDYGNTRKTNRFQSVIPNRWGEIPNDTYAINKNAVKRWISKGGVKRKCLSINKEISRVLTSFLERILLDALYNCQSKGRNIITPADVLTSLIDSRYFGESTRQSMMELLNKLENQSLGRRKALECFSRELERFGKSNRKCQIARGTQFEIFLSLH